jgi:hypothetical protein
LYIYQNLQRNSVDIRTTKASAGVPEGLATSQVFSYLDMEGDVSCVSSGQQYNYSG